MSFGLYVLGYLIVTAGLIYGAIKSYGGSEAKLPIAGNLAQKWV